MLTRQKIVLALLSQAKKPLNRLVLVKLVFLLRNETNLKQDQTFYDFVPYKYGPFSFSLYRELSNLQRDGYIEADDEHIFLCDNSNGLYKQKIDELPSSIHNAVIEVLSKYKRTSQKDLIRDVYSRYPWYATKSELTDLKPNSTSQTKQAIHAVFTIGYQEKSVDAFFNSLLKERIELIIDVRANPISRRYGFSKKQLYEIATKLGLQYCHKPKLGIRSEYRANLTNFSSYQALLNEYEFIMLPKHDNEIEEVNSLMMQRSSVLVCYEKDIRCCHRSRLAKVIALRTGLNIMHL